MGESQDEPHSSLSIIVLDSSRKAIGFVYTGKYDRQWNSFARKEIIYD